MLKQAASLLLVIVITAAAGALLAGAGVATRRLTVPLQPLYATVDAPSSVTVRAPAAPKIPLPAVGSLAIEGDDGALLAAADADSVRPTGSVAKTMTALLTLRAHPLQAGQPGPVLTMTATDVALYRTAIADHGSAVPVEAGERLSEQQLLLALLLPSANNIASTLADWVAGSESAFVTQLNATAESMGMRHTHFADASGYSAHTVSTASDLVILARAALAQPALMAVAATQRSTLPDGTVLRNLDSLLSVSSPHWLGIKTGWTPAAGGCLLFAASAPVGSARIDVTVIGVVLGQPPAPGVAAGHPELGGAFRAALAAVRAALAGYTTVDLTSALKDVTGRLGAPWGNDAPLAVRHGSQTVVVRGPLPVLLHVSDRPAFAPVPAGTAVATVEALTAAGPRLAATLITTSRLAAPSWTWRLLNE